MGYSVNRRILRLGRQHSAGQEFGSALEIASWKMMGMGATLKASDNSPVNNSVNYFSPAWGGVRLGASYSFDIWGDQSSGKKLPSYSLAAQYEQGPITVVATWEKTFLANAALADAWTPIC